MPEYDMAVDVNGQKMFKVVLALDARDAVYQATHPIPAKADAGSIEWRKISDAEPDE